jgi:HK97 gp10 family phage protein
VDLDLSEFNRLSYQLAGAGPRVAPLMRLVVRKTAADIERDAKTFAPVDTGFLRNSIGITMAGNVYYAAAEIGPTAEYGVYVEYGTSRMAPAAYMGPAFDRHSGEFIAAMEELAARGLDG